jgi:hypothetical protein
MSPILSTGAQPPGPQGFGQVQGAPSPGGEPMRAWSQPPLPLLSPGRPGEDASGSLTYQVYTADAARKPRAPSMVSFPDAAPKSVGLRVLVALVAVCVVGGTIAAIVFASSDDSPGAAKGASSASAASVQGPSIAPLASTAVLPDPSPSATAALVAPPAAATEEPPPPPVAPPATAKGAKPKAAGSTAPKVALPPNPFGGPASPAPKPPAKKK